MSIDALGRDVGPVGRMIRLVLGLAIIGAAGWLLIDNDLSAPELAVTGLFLILITLFYLAMTWLLGRRLLGRISPWTATTLFLTPVVLLGVLPGVPTTLRVAVMVYYGVSLLVIAVIGYGGCEVVGIPMAILRRRDVVYCPLNAADAVERPLTRNRRRAPASIAGALAIAAVFFLLARQWIPADGFRLPFDHRWAVVLFVPTIVILALDTWSGRQALMSSPHTRHSGLDALALTGALLTVAVTGSIVLFFTAVLAIALGRVY
jgi:hypothetical protein